MSYITELTEDYLGIVHVGKDLVLGQELIDACAPRRSSSKTRRIFITS